MAKRKIKQILGGIITHLSLCPAGANNISTVYKTADGEEDLEFSVITKQMTELGEIASLVYVPNQVDLQDDFAGPEAIKELAYSFAQKGKGIDIVHNEKVLPKSAAFVAESYIVQEGDIRFAQSQDYDGNPVDPTGGWAVVVKVNDENLRKLYRSGQWQGISMGGFVHKKDLESGPSGTHKTKPNSNGEDTEMTDEQLKALSETMTKANGVLATTIVESLAKTLKPEPKKKDEPTPEEIAKATAKTEFMAQFPMPVMPPNPNDAQMVLFQKAARVIELAKTVDPTDMTSVFEFHNLRKAIMEGKEENVTINKAADPWGFHLLTNQTTDEVKTTKTKDGKVDVDGTITMTAKATDVLSSEEVDALLDKVPSGMAEPAKT